LPKESVNNHFYYYEIVIKLLFQKEKYIYPQIYIIKKMRRLKAHKAQAAMEYLLVVGISFIIITSIGYYFLIQKSDSQENMVHAQVQQIGDDVVKNVEEVYFAAGASKKTMEITIPEEVDRIVVENSNTLVIRLNDGSETVISSKIPFFVFYEGLERFSKNICIQKITYKGNEYVIVCAIEDCNCQISQNETDCTNGQDDDIDGKIDGQDPDCCPFDVDIDGYTDANYFGPYVELYQTCQAVGPYGIGADDCDDTNESIHPGAPELCDEIDQDCDGLKDDVFGCKGFDMDDCPGGLCFYFEEGACGPGYDPIVSVSDPTNAHVQNLGGANGFAYELCYMENPNNVCPTRCVTVQNSVCGAGYYKVFSVQDLDLDGGSHVDGPNSAVFNNPAVSSSVCCQADCSTALGGIVCRATPIGASCLSDESCMFSLDTLNPWSTGHISPCNDIYFNNKVCCKIT
jgi:uncharacterized protein (UPF0333 family)